MYNRYRTGLQAVFSQPNPRLRIWDFICRLNLAGRDIIVSTMMDELVDVTCQTQISELTRRVVHGGEITREEALWLLAVEDRADIFDVMAGANRIREHFKGNKIHQIGRAHV